MSIYRCNQCDEQKDNDIECLYDVNDKQICQSCVDDEVDLLNEPEFSDIIDESEKELEGEVKKARSQEELIMENINLNMKIITYEFRCKGLEYEVKQLKEKLNNKGVINDDC